MIVFEVSLNNKKITTAGVSKGVTSTSISHVIGQKNPDGLRLHVGGLDSKANEFLTWKNHILKIGDEIQIKILESSKANKAAKRKKIDRQAENKHLKDYVRLKAKEFGWKLTEKKP